MSKEEVINNEMTNETEINESNNETNIETNNETNELNILKAKVYFKILILMCI